ncbi:hypothetical protein MicvaDRAFT_0001, partial [Microcoleus vaginatus FGP-2]
MTRSRGSWGAVPVKDGEAAAKRGAGEPIFSKEKLGGPLILDGDGD